MIVSYKKLWKILIDRDMKKKDLEAAAHVRVCSHNRRYDIIKEWN